MLRQLADQLTGPYLHEARIQDGSGPRTDAGFGDDGVKTLVAQMRKVDLHEHLGRLARGPSAVDGRDTRLVAPCQHGLSGGAGIVEGGRFDEGSSESESVPDILLTGLAQGLGVHPGWPRSVCWHCGRDGIARSASGLPQSSSPLLAFALLIAGAVLGVLVWRAGRRVLAALIAWEELPDRVAPGGSGVHPDMREAVDAETPAGLAQRRRAQLARAGRLALGAMGLLVGLTAILYAVVGPGRDEDPLISLAAGAVLAVAAIIVIAGQLRLAWRLNRRSRRLERKSARGNVAAQATDRAGP